MSEQRTSKNLLAWLRGERLDGSNPEDNKRQAADEIERLDRSMRESWASEKRLAAERDRLRAELEHKERYYAQFDLVPRAAPETTSCPNCGGTDRAHTVTCWSGERADAP